MPTSPTKRSQNKRNQQTNQQRTHHEVATTSSPSLEELLKRIESLEDKVAELESELIVSKNGNNKKYHKKWMTSTSIKEEHV